MPNLTVDTDRNNAFFDEIAAAVAKTLKQTAKLKAEVLFVSDQEIKELNKQTRNTDKVTDVLSFPTLDGIRGKVLKVKDYPFDTEDGVLFIGSIVLCEQKIAEQAEELGHSTEREMQYLTVHGFMHLFGYDHMEESDKAEMREKEKQAMLVLGVQD